jgi:fatty-acyl-CoA synthase
MTQLTEAYWAATGTPEPLTTIGEQLQEASDAYPTSPGLFGFSAAAPSRLSNWTYRELYACATAGARGLRARVGERDRVAICAPNFAEWVLVYFSAALAGIEVVPLNPTLSEPEMKRILEDAGCVALFVVKEHRGHALAQKAVRLQTRVSSLRHLFDLADWASFADGGTSGELPVVRPDDVALVQYTSGTTGEPKGAMLTHMAMTHAALRSGRALGIARHDVYANPFPLFHVGGTVGAIGVCLAYGAALALLPAYSPAGMVDLIADSRATVAAGVPTVLRALLDPLRSRPELAGRLRAVNTGATTVPAQLVEDYDDLGVRISICYGQSECPTITRARVGDRSLFRSQTVGQPVDGLEVKLVDRVTGKRVGVDEVGELCVRGTNVMAGYLGRPDATKSVLDSDGWLRTGDLATMGPDGHLSIVGRLKDIIIRGGENVYPREVEDVLMAHPAVRDVAVIGSPDDEFGEQVLAVVVPATDETPDWSSLAEFARRDLASFKVPRRWKLAVELPRNAAGKVEKYRLNKTEYEIVEESGAQSH